MSQGVGDRTLEGAIVCRTLSYLPTGIGNNAIVVRSTDKYSLVDPPTLLWGEVLC